MMTGLSAKRAGSFTTSLRPLSTSAKLRQPLLLTSMQDQYSSLFCSSSGVLPMGSLALISSDVISYQCISSIPSFHLRILNFSFEYEMPPTQIELLCVMMCWAGLQCRIMWQFKPKTIVARLLTNLAIVYSVFYNPDLMEKVCGPFTLPISHKHHLLIVIALMEVIRVVYSNLMWLLRKWGLLQKQKHVLAEMLTIKYIFILIIKIWLIFDQSHRKKFYLHTCLLEGAILGAAILFDCFSKENIKEVGELLIVQGLYRLALVYVLTQTFCPNLILYYSITNLLVFILSQVEAQSRYGLNKSLYVKHDIYRFLFLSLIFFFLTSITQVSSYGVKMLVVFFLSLKWHFGALRDYEENKFSRASWELTGVIIFLSLSQIFYSLFDG